MSAADKITVRDTLRRQILAGLNANGIIQDASMIADVAVHAADQAIEALVRATSPLDGTAWANAYGIALQAVIYEGNARLEALKTQLSQTLSPGSFREFSVDTSQ